MQEYPRYKHPSHPTIFLSDEMITGDEKGVTSKISIHADLSWLRGQIPVRCDFKIHGKSLCQKTSPVEFESKYFSYQCFMFIKS